MIMYEPEQIEIADKVQELLANAIADDDYLIDSLILCLPYIRKVYDAGYFEIIDCKYDFKDAVDSYLIKSLDLADKARDMLIAEAGTVIRTDVDDYKFVPHDTRD
jgi:uncharacterized protein YeeX (DUF496 family)